MNFLSKIFMTSVLALSLSTYAQAEDRELTPVSPTEDLMNEHGILNRILLVYEEIMKRIKNKQEFNAHIVAQAAEIIQKFIHEYHEKNEEQYIFPLFKNDKKLNNITKVLIEQHTQGGAVTTAIQKLIAEEDVTLPKNKKKLRSLLKKFITMYRPHEAREATVVFPAVHTMLEPDAFAKLGDIFEDTEHQKFGPEGFEKILAQVVVLEKELGIYDLAQFTPHL